MMNPVYEDLELYFWGESLPDDRAIACEKLVASDPELRRNYHQVSMLKRRFHMLRESMSESDEAARHRWLIRSRSKEPIPKHVQVEVSDIIETLRIRSLASNQIYREIQRRIGPVNIEEHTASYSLESLDMSSSVFSERSLVTPEDEFLDISELLSSEKKMPFSRSNSVIFVERSYPEVVHFMRHYFIGRLERWRDGSFHTPVLSQLEKQTEKSKVMAAIELIDLVSNLVGE